MSNLAWDDEPTDPLLSLEGESDAPNLARGTIAYGALPTTLSSRETKREIYDNFARLSDTLDASLLSADSPDELHALEAAEASRKVLKLAVEYRWADGALSTSYKGSWTEPTPLNVSDAVLHRMRCGKALREDSERVGHQLFTALMSHRELATDYALAMEQATRDRPLHLWLHSSPEDKTERSDVAGDPFWEAMHDRERCRHLGAALEVRLLRARVDEDLGIRKARGNLRTRIETRLARSRLTVAFASPRVRGDGTPLSTLALINEIQALNEISNTLCATSGVYARVVPRVGLDNIADVLSDADLFHFSGHGEAGQLLLQSQQSRAEPLTGLHLEQLLSSPLRLVTLNCCRGGVTGRDGDVALPFMFLRCGVHSVVAMQGDLEDEAALVFARELYLRIAGGDDVATAVQKARWRLFAEQRHGSWFLPGLWCLAPLFSPVRLESASAQDDVVQREVRNLDDHALQLKPAAAILERIHTVPSALQLSDEDRAALVQRLALELKPDAGGLDAQAITLLDDHPRIEHLIRNSVTLTTPIQALEHTLRAFEDTLLPRLDRVLEAAGNAMLPARAEVSKLRTRSRQAVASGPPLGDEPLALPEAVGGNLSRLVAQVVDHVSLPEAIVKRCLVHLLAGRHVILVGPPGTGKSTIAKKLCEALGYRAELVTANPEWTSQDVIGGLSPYAHEDTSGEVRMGYAIRDGCVVGALKRNWTIREGRWARAAERDAKGVWLIIDEINRAQMDHAFGDLFSALVSGEINVPSIASVDHEAQASRILPIPQDFRLIGTANTADRHLLFQMSEALKRRFAFVEVPAFFSADRQVPSEHIPRLVKQLARRPQLRALQQPDLEHKLNNLITLANPLLGRVRALHPLGIAQLLDAVSTSLVEHCYTPDSSADQLLGEALADQLAQALESVSGEALLMMASLLNGTLPVALRDALARWLTSSDDLTGPCRSVMVSLRDYLAEQADSSWHAVAAALDKALETSDWTDVASSLPDDAGTLKALPVTDPLVRRLRKLADEHAR